MSTVVKRNPAMFCSTCGKKRGTLEARRDSWGTKTSCPGVPRSDDPTQRPWQIHNDLIVVASVYRNGGTSEDCHLCDDCLRIGLRAIKLEIDCVLEVIEAGADKDAELATLTQRLASVQLELSNTAHQLEVLKRVNVYIPVEVINAARDRAFGD